MDKKEVRIPDKGIPAAELLATLHQYRAGDIRWREGRTWSMVYYVDAAHQQLIEEAYRLYFSENYLNPFAFASLKRMENEVLRMALRLFNAPSTGTGTMTSGGTESIFLAVYTYREWAREHHPNIRKPEIVVPRSIHPAFDKAAHMLGITVRKAELGEDLRAVPALLEKLITPNTIFLAASAPVYPHGGIDPIGEIAAIAAARKLPFHVDACIGGYLLPWVERLGYPVETWDFRIAGVTSISADLHKFGYAAKGASTLLYRSMDYLKHQFYVATDFPGGIYVTPTLLGSRPGGAIAAAWTALHALGEEGYMRLAGEVMAAAAKMKEAFATIPELQIVGKPSMNILAFSTVNNQPDIFVVADYLEEQGWMVDRQQFPNCIHVTVMPYNIPVVETYINNLQEAITYAKANPAMTAKGNAALYGLMARIPFRGVVANNVRRIFEDLYTFQPPADGDSPTDSGEDGEKGAGNALPESPRWMGWVNRVLTSLERWRK